MTKHHQKNGEAFCVTPFVLSKELILYASLVEN